jgi:chromosome segregation ATPase
MSKDGDNSELAAQLNEAKEKLEEKETALAELKEKLDKTGGIAANAEKKINEMGNELGALRKEKKELEEKLAAVGDNGPDGKGKKTVAEQVAELEDELTAEEEKVLDEAWQRADDELKAKIESDQKLKLEFLKQAKPARTPSSWRNKPVKQPDKTEKLLDAVKSLFDRENNRRRVPGVQSRSGLKPDGASDAGEAKLGPVAQSVLGRR